MGVVVLVTWMLVPAVRVLPHVIYAEWIMCGVTFLGISFATRRVHAIDVEGVRALQQEDKTSAVPAQH